MGRIIATVDVMNISESAFSKKLDALVDTDASDLTLPSAWKDNSVHSKQKNLSNYKPPRKKLFKVRYVVRSK